MPKYQGLPFSCVNPRGRFRTDTGGQRGGYSHAPHSATLGSALPGPLIVIPDGSSLWLEHVIDSRDGWDPLWLMWYDKQGNPRLTMSGVFDLPQLASMTDSLVEFLKGARNA